MNDEEWVRLVWLLWIRDWPYSTQQDRAELLATKDRVEQLSGWRWSAPYQLDNPPIPS
jgi:hypothetical protein